MATVLNFDILSSFSIIFVFIAVFIGGWGIAYLVNPFGFQDEAKKKVYAILAFALSFILILNQGVLAFITFSIPWFSVIFLVAFFMLFFAKMFNPGMDASGLIESPVVYGFLIFFVALVVLFGFGGILGQDLLERQPGVTDADRIVGETTPVDSFVPVDEFQGEEVIGQETSPRNTIPGTDQPTASNNFGDNLALTLFHPKILGMLFMMLLGTITILLIAR